MSSTKNVEPLPVWHPSRKFLTAREAAEYVKYFYGVNVGEGRFRKWRKDGTKLKDGRTIYLKVARKFSRRMLFAKADIEAYLKEIMK